MDLAARKQLLHGLDGLDGLGAEIPTVASILVTHHLEDRPASTTHVVLLRDGGVVAQGAMANALTSATISECVDHPVVVRRTPGRRSATSPGG